MKGFVAAAALAAAFTPALAGAQPVGSDKACGVGMLQGQGEDSCRFTATASTLGQAGFTDTGWTLTHKEKVAVCENGAFVHKVNVVEDLGGGAGPIVEQTALVAGRTYTLTIEGNGGILAGGPSGGAPSPSATEPADAVEDKTNGVAAGSAC